MIGVVLRIAMALFLIFISILWIIAIGESDGHCHIEDCSRCPYEGDCPEQDRKEKRK